MKLIDIVDKIDKSESNEDWINVTKFSSEFDYNFDYVEQDKLKSYWIGNWYSTDTYVGYRMYFFNNVPVCVSSQNGRKYNEVFLWFSRDLANQVRDYLISLDSKGDNIIYDLCDINEDIGEGFKVHFTNEVLDWNKATLNNEPIHIMEKIVKVPDWDIDTEIKVRINDGTETIVNVEDLIFKFNLKTPNT